MRKRIWRMSEDKFDNIRPKIAFSHDKIQLVGLEGQHIQGDFSIYSTNDYAVKGIVYSSNPYVRVIRPAFSGTEARIKFEVIGQNYVEGDHLTGYFTIICNQLEHRLPFDVQFEAQKLMCSRGNITDMASFVDLAKEHWKEALGLFYSAAFEEFMEKQEVSLYLLYQGFKKSVPSSSSLEGFLTAAGYKEKVSFSMDTEPRKFFEILENRKETIEISKNTWGYIELAVTSDADFITVEKEVITSDYFMGSSMSLNFYIHKDLMHEGKNFGRIKVASKTQEMMIEIMATSQKDTYEKIWVELPIHKCRTQITNLYLDYRSKKLTTGEWCGRTIEQIDKLQLLAPATWNLLMRAQCLIVNKQRQEALWIIADLKKEILDKTSVEWAYLLYLCTLLEQEASYVDRLTKEIEAIFRYHPEDVRIFWLLLFLREEYYQNSLRKFKAIEQWMEAGCHSPFLYMEVMSIWLQDPYMLRNLTGTNLLVLRWGARRQLISKDLAMQLLSILEKENSFDVRIWKLALAAYEILNDEAYLPQMLSYLLKHQQYHERYVSWYLLGIEKDVRLHGIYEAYMMSLPDYSTEALPQMLLMYFQYSCNLPDQKKALLYANVITNREKTPALYQQYIKQMEQFAITSMKQGRINDNLAIIYQNVLQVGFIGEEVASAVAGLLYMCKIFTVRNDVKRVFLYQESYNVPIVVPVIDHYAYVPIISKQYCLFLELANGELLCDQSLYAMQKMLYVDSYLYKLKQLAPLALPFVISDIEEKQCYEDFELADIPKIQAFVTSSLVSKKFVVQKYPLFVSFLQNHCREEVLEKHFLEEVDYSSLDANTRSFIISLFISREKYQKAYEIMEQYCGIGVDDRLLIALIDEKITELDFARDEFLLSLAGYLLAKEQTSPFAIAYLCEHYIGPTKDMLYLWHKAKEIDLTVLALEENLLFQALYAESCMEQMQPIFDSYLLRGKDKMLVEAYMNYWSHEYMLAHESVPNQVFTYLAYEFDRGFALKDSACLAYMKYLSMIPLLSERELKVLDYLLNKYMRRNMYFAFYKNMDQRLIIKYQLYDKQFVEYRGNPGEKIKIIYHQANGKTYEEEMIEMYEGIFVKQFVLFFGEKITYELQGQTLPDDLSVCSGEVSLAEIVEYGEKDRFGLLNQMQSAYIYGDTETLAASMKQYHGLHEVTKDLFTIL